ncbi:MAG: hypothetical protein SPI29_06625 [Bacteroides uniformis]|nr:hypothetical protein [Bacteroides uniformis]
MNIISKAMLHHTYLYLLEKAALTQATAKATCTIFEYIYVSLVVHAKIAVIATISNNTFKINRINLRIHIFIVFTLLL